MKYWVHFLVLSLTGFLLGFAALNLGSNFNLNLDWRVESFTLAASFFLILRMGLGFYQNFLAIRLNRHIQTVLNTEYIDTLGSLKREFSLSQVFYRLNQSAQAVGESLSFGFASLATSLSVAIVLTAHFMQNYPNTLWLLVLGFIMVATISQVFHRSIYKLGKEHHEQESRLFDQQKHLIYESDYLLATGRLEKWKVNFKTEQLRLEATEKRLSLQHQLASQFQWALQFLFVALILSPLADLSGLDSSGFFWLYLLVGTYLQAYSGWIQLGQIKDPLSKLEELFSPSPNNQKPIVSESPKLKAENLKIFFGENQKVHGLRALNFSWSQGDRVWISGPSGAGKTTLLKSLAGLHYNFTGSLELSSTLRVGYLPQPCYQMDGQSLDAYLGLRQDLKKEWKLVEGLGLKDFFESIHWNTQLNIGQKGLAPSRGQWTRLSLLRELIQKPQLLLLDEPTAHLDQESAKSLYRFLDEHLSHEIVIICEHAPPSHFSVSETILLDHFEASQNSLMSRNTRPLESLDP